MPIGSNQLLFQTDSNERRQTDGSRKVVPVALGIVPQEASQPVAKGPYIYQWGNVNSAGFIKLSGGEAETQR